MNVLISGATRGLGRAIAERFAKAGHHLWLIARSKEDLSSMQKQISQKDEGIHLFAGDLSNPSTLDEIGRDVLREHKIDVLINNLGIYREDSATEIKLEDIEQLLQLNLYSAIEMTKFCLPRMKSSKAGLIINIGSVMSQQAMPHATAYSISKHALKGWNDALRKELRTQGIKVTGIYPGAINTSSWDGIEANREAMIQTEDIAQLLLQLLEMSPSTLIEEIKISPLDFNG